MCDWISIWNCFRVEIPEIPTRQPYPVSGFGTLYSEEEYGLIAICVEIHLLPCCIFIRNLHGDACVGCPVFVMKCLAV